MTPWQVRYPYTKGVMCFRPKSPSRASKYPWGRPQHWAMPTARRAVNGLRLLAWLPSAHSDPTLVMDAASQVTAPKPQVCSSAGAQWHVVKFDCDLFGPHALKGAHQPLCSHQIKVSHELPAVTKTIVDEALHPSFERRPRLGNRRLGIQFMRGRKISFSEAERLFDRSQV